MAMSEPIETVIRVDVPVRARIWDGPTRLVHWSIVAFFGFSWWSAETHHMDWHRWSGYGVMGLVVFRLYWGLFGSQTARFASFVKSPRATFAYFGTLARRTPSEAAGHNPLGAVSVVAILLALTAQVTFGLFSVDVDGLESGPLSTYVDFSTGRRFAVWHEWCFTALQILAVVHIAAILFYLAYKRQNLVGPMITGRRRVAADPALRFAAWWNLALGIAVALVASWFVANGLRLMP
jgi:cytochrome b